MPNPALCTLARPGRHIGPACTAGLAIARGLQGMGWVPVIMGDRGGRLVACTRKRRHTGTVAGHRGTCAPRGTVVHLRRMVPVPRLATAKVASGIAETASGQRATVPERVSGLAGKRVLCGPMDSKRSAAAEKEPEFPCCDLSARQWSPAPSPPSRHLE